MTRKRNLKLSHVSKVEALVYDDKIKVEVFARAGATEFTCTGELELWCATNLIRQLRTALRKVRDEKKRMLDQAVENAEGPL
jgi:hypothetical protein